MPRNMTPQFAAALESRGIVPAFLVSVQFRSNTVYAWTGVGNLAWNGVTWQGLGKFLAISQVAESSTVEAQGLTLTLSGVADDLLSDGLTEVQPGLRCEIYLALFDPSQALIPDPLLCYAGLVDQPTMDISTKENTLTLAIENRLADMQRSQNQRYTDQQQRARYPNDAGLSFVRTLQDKNVKWQ